ncbi:MAG: right-handed parallel beta-helix repeat-containing protein [Planctomycetota bacterium]|nr:MAG: right-handed parallel beta-helix repeat-containing protein [Planctomycetota bacterium]
MSDNRAQKSRKSSGGSSIMVVVLLCIVGPLLAQEWYVDANAAAGGDGSEDAPWNTLAEAAAEAQAGATVYVAAGVYRETLRPAHSGSSDAPLRFIGAPGAIICGHDVISPDEEGNGPWQDLGEHLWAIDVSPERGLGDSALGRQQVRLDDQWLTLARWPNLPHAQGFSSDRAYMARALSGGVEEDSQHSLEGYSAEHQYGWYDVQNLPDGDWDGAFMDLAPGDGWWHRTGTVQMVEGERITYSWPRNSSWSHREIPGPGDWFYLWGRLAAVDQPGEFWHDVEGNDGPAGRLYLQLSAETDPRAAQLTLRGRERGIDLRGRMHITVEGFHLRGCGVEANAESQHLHLRRLHIDHGAQELDVRQPLRSAIHLRGSQHLVEDCDITHVYGRGIDLRNNNNQVRNTVVAFTSDHGIGTDAAREVAVHDNSVFASGNTAVSISAPASTFLRNRVAGAGLRIIDIAVMNTWNAGDMEGTEIAWNWVSHGMAPLSYTDTHSWNGSQGIRLDGGGAPLGCSNAVIHHNVVWDTTSSASIAIWAMAEGQENADDSQIGVYYNSCADAIAVNHNGSVVGHDIRGNIARNLVWNTDAEQSDAVIEKNLFMQQTHPENLRGDPAWRSSWRRDKRLRSDSMARNAGAAIPGVVEGEDPDLGAYPYGAEDWEPGAVIGHRHIAALQPVYERAWDGSQRLRIEGLPLGRALPLTARVRVAHDYPSSHLYHRYAQAGQVAQAVFSMEALPEEGTHVVELTLDGEQYYQLDAPIAIHAPRIDGYAVDAVSRNGGTLDIHGAYLQRLAQGALQRIHLPSHVDLGQAPVPIRFDSATLIANDIMRLDGHDLRVVMEGDDGAAITLDHWLQSGLNTSRTLLWFAWPQELEATWHGLAGEDVLWLSSQVHGRSNRSDPSVVTRYWPMLLDQSLLVWLHGNDLTPDTAIATWNNRGVAQGAPGQSDDAAQPQAVHDSVSGAAARFDGEDDHLVLQGLGSGPMHQFIVYRNLDPGSVAWQRLLSSRANTDGPDYTGDGHFNIVASDDEGAAIPQEDWTIRRNNNAENDASRENLTLGRYSMNTTSAFRGEMAEVLLFDRILQQSERNQVNAYLDALLAGMSHVADDDQLSGLSVELDGEALPVLAHQDGRITVRMPSAMEEGPLTLTVSAEGFGPVTVPGELWVVSVVRGLGLWAGDSHGPLPINVQLGERHEQADGVEAPALFPGLDGESDHDLEIEVLHGDG